MDSDEHPAPTDTCVHRSEKSLTKVIVGPFSLMLETAQMPGSRFLELIRSLWSVLRRLFLPVAGRPESQNQQVRHLRLMQLEDRRVLNASLGLMTGIEMTGGEELLVQDGLLDA